MENMIKEIPLEDFKNSGFLWLINQTLHLFGMCLVIEYEDKKAVRMYPARCKFRGFSEHDNDQGYRNVTKYMERHAAELERDCAPED